MLVVAAIIMSWRSATRRRRECSAGPTLTVLPQPPVRLDNTYSGVVRHLVPSGESPSLPVAHPLTPGQLFGHEIVAILCGLVWGLGPGFGIVAAGTFLGELGNF